MGALLQLFKDFFLILTTGYIVFWFFADYRKALLWYLILFAFISAIGLNRVIYNENVVVPLMLLFFIMIKPIQITKPNGYYLVLFIYMITLTYINGLSIVDTYSRGTYLFLVLLIYSNHLFSNPDYAFKIVLLIWLITLGIAFNFFVYGGELLSVTNIDSGTRDIILDTGIKGSNASSKGADLNYFSSSQAIGVIISIILITYTNKILPNVSLPLLLKQIINSKTFRIALLLICGIQIWFVFRGLSRGGLLVLLTGIVTLVYMLKKKKYLFYGGLFIIILYLIMNQVGIIDLLIERFDRDETGTSGRTLIWGGMFGSVYKHGGILQIILGGGVDWPWWEFWRSNTLGTKQFASSHNQWLSIFVSVGLLGLFLFTIPLVKGIRNNFKNPNPMNSIRIVLFFSFLAMTLSLEPLVYNPYVWFITALAATFTPNLRQQR